MLEILFGLGFILVPGYLFFFAFFLGTNKFNVFESIIVGLTFCFSEVILVSFGLNFSPWGITYFSIIISQVLVVIISIMVIFFRRNRITFQKQISHLPNIKNHILRKLGNISLLEILLLFIFVMSIGATGLIGLYGYIAPKPIEGFTEFYVVGMDDRFESLPSTSDIVTSYDVVLVIENHENEQVSYRLERKIGDFQEVIAIPLMESDQIYYLRDKIDMSDENDVIYSLYLNDSEVVYRFLKLGAQKLLEITD